MSDLNEEVIKLEVQVQNSPYRYSLANTTIAAHWMERHPFVVPSSSVLRKKIALDALIVDMVSALRASR